MGQEHSSLVYYAMDQPDEQQPMRQAPYIERQPIMRPEPQPEKIDEEEEEIPEIQEESKEEKLAKKVRASTI